MVERVRLLFLSIFLALSIQDTHAFESLRGPTFSNSSNMEVDVSVESDGKVQSVLNAFPAHQLIALPRELRAQSIIMVVGQRRYELTQAEYALQSSGLPETRQLWIFDGNMLCVLNVSRLKGKPHTPPVCEGAGVPR